MSMRIVLKSTDSSAVHPDNNPQNFRVRLPRSLPLTGDWTVELTEFRNTKLAKTTDREIFVYCSVCDDSIVGGSSKPLLRRIVLKNTDNIIFEHPYRIPLRTKDLRDIHVYIKDSQDADVSFLTGDSTVTLVFRRL